MLANESRMPPRVQSAPSLLPSDDIEHIFSNISYRDFMQHEPIAEEGDAPTAGAADMHTGAGGIVGMQQPAHRQPTPPIAPGFAQPHAAV